MPSSPLPFPPRKSLDADLAVRHKHLGVAGWLMDHGAKADVKDKVRWLWGGGLCV